MKRLSAFLIAALSLIAVCRAQTNQPVQDITVTTSFYTVTISIEGDPQLTAMAHMAFQAHGRYDRVAGGGAYTLKFTTLTPTQVRVDVTAKNGSVVLSQTGSGATLREAFYRAADAAVAATGGGRGFFTARLAFVSNRTGRDAIYVGDLFMNDVRHCPVDAASRNYTIYTPRWSPDGSKVLFTSDYRGFHDIYQLDLDQNKAPSLFLSLNGTNMGARYSADGSRVVAVLTSTSGRQNICLLSPTGRGAPNVLASGPDAMAAPCFSPDGRQIVYASAPGPRLYTINAGGGSPVPLPTGMGYASEADWNRVNPTQIAFTTQTGRVFRIAVYDTATRKTRIIQVKGLTGDLVEPSWLPDGRHVVCTWRASNQRAIYILDTLDKKDDTSGNRATRISSAYAEHPSVWWR